MGRSSLNLLIPARFLLTVGHLVSVLTMVHTRKENLSSAVSADPFSSGFPAFEEYLAVVLGLEREPIRRSAFDVDEPAPAAEPEAHWPEAAPAPPPPVRTEDDLETVVALSPDQALHGTTVELELGDGTLVEVGTPPRAGDGWRWRRPDVQNHRRGRPRGTNFAPCCRPSL